MWTLGIRGYTFEGLLVLLKIIKVYKKESCSFSYMEIEWHFAKHSRVIQGMKLFKADNVELKHRVIITFCAKFRFSAQT